MNIISDPMEFKLFCFNLFPPFRPILLLLIGIENLIREVGSLVFLTHIAPILNSTQLSHSLFIRLGGPFFVSVPLFFGFYGWMQFGRDRICLPIDIRDTWVIHIESSKLRKDSYQWSIHSFLMLQMGHSIKLCVYFFIFVSLFTFNKGSSTHSCSDAHWYDS